MKKSAIIVFSFFVAMLFSCKNDQQIDLNYNRVVKSTHYSASGEVEYWSTFYYMNDRIVKQENSIGDIVEWKYDENGNILTHNSNNSKIEYEYNSDNKITKTISYSNGQLLYYIVTNYQDTLVTSAYNFDNKNDTTGWSIYYYNSEDRIDSIYSDDKNTYYYFSKEVDSVITKTKLGLTMSKEYFKFENGKKMYEERRLYTDFGIEFQYSVKNWEYNGINLLIRETEDQLYPSGEKQWIDTRNVYNEFNKILRTEEYNVTNQLLFYSNYSYDNEILVKIEYYDNLNNLNSYETIENIFNK
jgi:YD repeat-containing protein